MPNSSVWTTSNRLSASVTPKLPSFRLNLQSSSRPLTCQNSARHTPRAATPLATPRVKPRPAKQAIEGFFAELDSELGKARQGHWWPQNQLLRQVPKVAVLVAEYQGVANAQYLRVLQSMQEVLETLQEGSLPYWLDAQVRYIVNSICPVSASSSETPAFPLAQFERSMLSAKQLQVMD